MGALARSPGAYARHSERMRAQPVWSVRVGRRCDASRVEASRTPKHPSSGPGRALGRHCSARAWPLVRPTSRRRPRAGAPGAEDLRRAAGGRWRRALFLAPLVPVPTAVHLRRRGGRRQWRGRRLLRVSVWESVVVLARARERLTVPVRTGRGRSGGGPRTAVAVAACLARCRLRTAEELARRDRRCGSGRRSRLRVSGGRAPPDPAPTAAVDPVSIGRYFSPRPEMLGPRNGELRRGGSRLADRLRSALVSGSREIRGHAPGSAADHSQQRRRPALDTRAGKQEEPERDPHRRNENGGGCRRQMNERLHIRVSAVAAVR
jgi:hypothetical protein